MLTRREVIGSLLGCATVSAGALAQSSLGPNAPFQTLSPRIEEDRRKVVEFFSYVCPVCQRMHKGIASWAKTLPRALTFESVAIPIGDSDLESKLLLFRAAISIRFAPLLAAWDEIVFDSLYAGKNDPVEIARLAVKDLGINGSQLVSAPAEQVTARLITWVDRAKAYRIKTTPTIAVAGLYTASPDALDEREDLFPTLLNGLISRALV